MILVGVNHFHGPEHLDLDTLFRANFVFLLVR